MLYVVILHVVCLVVFMKDRYTTFMTLFIFYDMYENVGVPNMEKGGSFYNHCDLAAISPIFTP